MGRRIKTSLQQMYTFLEVKGEKLKWPIYINETLQGALLRKVLCHEITHAAMFSYNVNLSLEQQELIADLISTYGDQIIYITNKIFNKLGSI